MRSLVDKLKKKKLMKSMLGLLTSFPIFYLLFDELLQSYYASYGQSMMGFFL